MNINKKRIFSGFICFAVILSSLTVSAFGAENEKEKIAVSLSNIYDLAYKNNASSKIAESELYLFNKNNDDLSDALNSAWDSYNGGSEYSYVMLQSLMSQQMSTEQREITKLSTENTRKQAAIGSKGLLISYYSLKNELINLQNSKEMCERNLNVLKVRKTMGMATENDVQGLENTLKKLEESINDANTAISVLYTNIRIYVGVSKDKFDIAQYESQTSEAVLKEIQNIEYEKDLEDAKKNSYSLRMKKLASDDRSTKRSYIEDISYEDLKAKFPVKFKETYEELKTKASALKLSEDIYAVSKKNAAAAEIKFNFGLISQKDKKDILAQLDKDNCALVSAQLNYELALNTYSAMKDGIMAA